MANKEALNFQEALSNKIKAWEKTEDFAKGSTNRQKLNRSLNLLLGSDPEVIIDMLPEGDYVPNNPREAMNLIRNLDIKTLNQMEILPLKGLGNKLVGHHSIAASTMQALRGMKPTERLKVYKGLTEMGQRFGMDPKQIFLIADKVHKSIAHGGDFGGVKTGVTLPYIVGETGDEFLRRFEEPVKKQLAMLERAVNANDTQKYYQAINTVENNLGLPKGTLIDPNTSLELKSAATTLLEPAANQVRDVVNAGDDISGGVQKILDNTKFKPKAVKNFKNIAVKSGVVKFIPGPIDDIIIGAGASAAVAGATLLTGGTPAQAADNAKNTALDFATGDLEGGSIESGTVEEYGGGDNRTKVELQRAEDSAQMPALVKQPVNNKRNTERLQLEERARQARERGGRVKVGAGKASFTLPEFGLSELFGFN